VILKWFLTISSFDEIDALNLELQRAELTYHDFISVSDELNRCKRRGTEELRKDVEYVSSSWETVAKGIDTLQEKIVQVFCGHRRS